MADNRKTTAYCAIIEHETDDNLSRFVIINQEKEDVISNLKSGLRGEDVASSSLRRTGNDSEETEEHVAKVGLDLYHFYNQLKKYYELGYISSRVNHVFVGGYFVNVLKNPAEEKFDIVEEVDGYPIYGLDEHQARDLRRKMDRFDDIISGAKLLPPAVLLSIVASYDSLFSDLTKSLLRLRPERYQSSDRQYTVSDLLALSSFEHLVEKVISDEVDSIMNRSHSDQISYFEKSFSVKSKELFSRWPEYVEIFERRNLAAHGGLCVNERYLNNCKNHGVDIKDLSIGIELSVNRKYLNNTLDVLIEFGTTLVFAAWQKQISTQREEAFQAIIGVAYDLIKSRRFTVAENVIAFALESYGKFASDMAVKMLKVNKAIAQKKADRNDEAEKTLSEEDWTAAAPMFKICVAAVQEQKQTVIELMPVVLATKEVSVQDFREWPAFDWVRAEDDVQKEFLTIFGTKLTPDETLSRISESSDKTKEGGGEA